MQGLMQISWSRCLLALVLALGLSWGRPAWAVDEATRAAVRDLGTEGVKAYQAGDYAAAREKLDEAFSVLRTAPLGLWSARALEKLGLLVQANERYLAAERAPIDSEGDPAAQQEAKATAAQEREALLPRIPRLTVRIEGADPATVALIVAGKDVPPALVGKPLPVNPGKVEVTARSGEAEAQAAAELAEGEAKEVVLTFDGSATPAAVATEGEPTQPADGAPASEKGLVARKWPAFVAGGVAVVGGVIWTIFGVQSIDAKGQAEACGDTGSTCDTAAEENQLRQQAWDAGNVATVGMVVTGVGLATAGVLWFTLPGGGSSKESAGASRGLHLGPIERVQVGVRPGGLTLRGTF